MDVRLLSGYSEASAWELVEFYRQLFETRWSFGGLAALRAMRDFTDVRRVLRAFNWKERALAQGGPDAAMLTTLIEHNAATGFTVVLYAIRNGVAPLHVHTGGADYGEVLVTLAGQVNDLELSPRTGRPLSQRPGDPPIGLGPGSVHAPSAEFVVGLFVQPHGSRLIPIGVDE